MIKFKYAIAPVVLAGALVTVNTAHAATASSTIQAEIVERAITLVNNAGLNFGQILPFSVAGYIQVNTDGSVSASNAQVVDASALRRSDWAVSGVPFGRYSITLPADTSVSISNGTSNMQLTNFVHNAGSSPSLNSAGTGGFSVGARLLVGANQPAGTYTGTFNVTVNYL